MSGPLPLPSGGALRCRNNDIKCFITCAVNLARLCPPILCWVVERARLLLGADQSDVSNTHRDLLTSLDDLLSRPSDNSVADLSNFVAALTPLKPDLMDGQMQDASELLAAVIDCVNEGNY
jgi:hypothetical protein